MPAGDTSLQDLGKLHPMTDAGSSLLSLISTDLFRKRSHEANFPLHYWFNLMSKTMMLLPYEEASSTFLWLMPGEREDNGSKLAAEVVG